MDDEHDERDPRHQAAAALEGLGEVLGSLTRPDFDLGRVLQVALERAVRLGGAVMGDIAARDGDVFRIKATFANPAHYQATAVARDYRPERGTVIGRVLLERRLIQIPDVLEDPEYELWDAQQALGYRSVIGVPMMSDGEIIGVFTMGRDRVAPFDAAEGAVVSLFAEQAAVAIRIATLFQTVERQRTELARFAPQVANLLSSDEGERLLAGHRREITALFADLRGFTAFAESAEPEELLDVVRQYHDLAGGLIVRDGGTVEHFAGDGLMAFFNDPGRLDDHEAVAVRTALELRDGFASLAERWHKRGYELGLGIGIAVGYATLGRIGFEGRYDYGAVGNVCILASRLSDAAEAGEVLISQRLHAAVEDRFESVPVDDLTLKGFSRPVAAFRVAHQRTDD